MLEPQIHLAIFWTTYSIPNAANIDLPSNTSIVGESTMILRYTNLYSRMPRTKVTGPVITIEMRGSKLTLVNSHQVMKAPIMMNSPWATLRTRATPYCRLSPAAIRA